MSGCPSLPGLRGYSRRRRLGDDDFGTDSYDYSAAASSVPSPTQTVLPGETVDQYGNVVYAGAGAPNAPSAPGGSSSGAGGSKSNFNINFGAKTPGGAQYTIQMGPNGQQIKVPVTAKPATGSTISTPLLIGGGVLLVAVLMGGRK
jgi:hypothetical protein